MTCKLYMPWNRIGCVTAVTILMTCSRKEPRAFGQFTNARWLKLPLRDLQISTGDGMISL